MRELASVLAEPRLDLQVVDQIRQLSAVRPGLFAKLVATFERNTDAMLASMPACIDGQDHEALRVAFHSLKGAAASLGARRLGALAGEVETAGLQRASQDELLQLLASIRVEYAAARDALVQAALTAS